MENKNAIRNDKRILNCKIIISSESVLIEQQIIYSLLESIDASEKTEKENLHYASY